MSLDDTYRARAVPPGSARYWSWLFADTETKNSLLGIYALTAEWRALADPSTESSVARIKLAWWRDEIGRAAAGHSLHPITRFLLELPGARPSTLVALQSSIDAYTAQIGGVPLERADELDAHATALYGTPLLVAAQFASPLDLTGVDRCTSMLAAGDYLARAVAEYAREIRANRLPFPVDQLLTAGIDNEELARAEPSARLSTYLDQLRAQAMERFAGAEEHLPRAQRAGLRHLAVLAALGMKHLAQRRDPSSTDFRLTDLYNAWTAARGAAAAR